MRLLRTISFFCIALLTAPLHAQEAPGEDVPGMRARRDAPGLELSPEERKELNNMFPKAPEEKMPEPPSAPEKQPAYVPSVPARDATPPMPAPETAPDAAAQPNTPVPLIEPEITPLKDSSLYMDNTRLLKFTILNKQTTRLYPMELTEGGSMNYGPLTIALIECWHSPPEMKPESAALLQITETRSDAKSKQLYLGWMFASTPSLNPFEHPVYDISVMECK